MSRPLKKPCAQYHMEIDRLIKDGYKVKARLQDCPYSQRGTILSNGDSDNLILVKFDGTTETGSLDG